MHLYTDSFIVGLITYFVAGLLVMKFYKKASGTDIIPNKGFWITSTSLVKVRTPQANCKPPSSDDAVIKMFMYTALQDGFVFTFGPCVRLIREKVRGRQGYSMQ